MSNIDEELNASPSMDLLLDENSSAAEAAQAETNAKKKSDKYVWRPPKEQATAQSYSPCPHVFFKQPVVQREVLSRKKYTAMLAKPISAPWRAQTPPTEMAALLRYKTRPLSARNVELAIPKKVYVKAHCEEHKDNVTPQMLERLQRVLEDEFHMTREEIKKFIKSGKKPKKLKKSEAGGSITELSTESRDWLRSMIDQLANQAADTAVADAESKTSKSSSKWIANLVSSAAEHATHQAEANRPSHRLEAMLMTVLQRIITNTGDCGRPVTPTDVTSTGKLISIVAHRMAGWIEDIVKISEMQTTGNEDIARVTVSEPAAGSGPKKTKQGRAKSRGRSKSKSNKHKKGKSGRGGASGYESSHGRSITKKQKDSKKKGGKKDSKKAEDNCTCSCICEKSKKGTAETTEEEIMDVVGQGEGDAGDTGAPGELQGETEGEIDVQNLEDSTQEISTETSSEEPVESEITVEESTDETDDQSPTSQEDVSEEVAEGVEGMETEPADDTAPPDEPDGNEGDVQDATEEAASEETDGGAGAVTDVDADAVNDSQTLEESNQDDPATIEDPAAVTNVKAEPLTPDVDSDAVTDEGANEVINQEPVVGMDGDGGDAEGIDGITGDVNEEAANPEGEPDMDTGELPSKPTAEESEPSEDNAVEAAMPEETPAGAEGTPTTEVTEMPTDQQTVASAKAADQTQDLIFKQLASIITDTPDKVKTERKEKLTRILESKFDTLVKLDTEGASQEDREVKKLLASKIANWIENMIEETDSNMQTHSKVQGGRGLTGPVTSTAVREWAKTMNSAMTVADNWAAWISRTVNEAEQKAAKKKGLIVRPDGETDKLSRQEWGTWKNDVRKKAVDFRMKKKEIAETAHEWTQFVKDKPVTSTKTSGEVLPEDTNDD